MVPIRFEREARFVLAAAMDVALELRHEHVRPEHLLFGIASRSPDLLPRTPELDGLKAALADLVTPRTDQGRQVRYTKETKVVLGRATDLAAKRGRATVSVGDLLESLEASPAPSDRSRALFESAGLRPVSDAGIQPPDERLDALEYIQVSDTSELAYYDQISRCIQEAVAAGVLIPGDRLPSIRQLAERLELAPGTVARAYRQLEADGVVLTAGASGTRISRPLGAVGDAAERVAELAELLRPVAVAAFHLGASMDDLSNALRVATEGVFFDDSDDV